MPKLLTRMSMIAALALGAPLGGAAFAQTTPPAPAETETEAAPTEQTTPPDQGVSMGEPVVDGQAPGQTYIREVTGDWSLAVKASVTPSRSVTSRAAMRALV